MILMTEPLAKRTVQYNNVFCKMILMTKPLAKRTVQGDTYFARRSS